MSRFYDSALGDFVAAQTTEIEREVNETTFPEIQYQQFIPVVSTGNPFAESVTYISTTQAGKAEFINGNADDVPMADAGLSASVKPIYTAGIGYGYGWQEVQMAQQLGFKLAAEKALAARRAYEEMVDDIAFSGNTEKNLNGLLDVPNSTSYTGGTWGWTSGTTTAAKIAADLIGLVNATGRGNKHTADTIILPQDKYVVAQTTFFGTSSRTALDMIKETFPGMQIGRLKALETAAASSKHRYLAYRRSPDVLCLYLPMPHRFLPVFQPGPLRFEVPGVFRVGGVNVKRKVDVAYADGSA